MIRTRTVYTKSQYTRVITLHHCSKCGKPILQKQYLTSEYSYTGGSDKKAAEIVQRRTNELKEGVRHITADSDFGAFKFSGKCNLCGNVEPWARIFNPVFEKPLTVLRSLALIDLVYFLLHLQPAFQLSQYPTALYILAGIWLLAEVSYLIYKAVIRSKIRQLPQKSLPRIITSQEELQALTDMLTATTGDRP